MTTTDHAPDAGTGERSWLQEDMRYIKVAGWLGLLTAIEVFTYFESVHQAPRWVLMVVLFTLMVVKFGMVAAVFMHLADDHPIFTKMIVGGLALAWPVYGIAGYAMGWIDIDLNAGTSLLKIAILAVPPLLAGYWLGFKFQGGDGGH